MRASEHAPSVTRALPNPKAPPMSQCKLQRPLDLLVLVPRDLYEAFLRLASLPHSPQGGPEATLHKCTAQFPHDPLEAGTGRHGNLVGKQWRVGPPPLRWTRVG